MARINRFEEIEAWQKSRQLAGEIYQISGRGTFARDFGLRDQIRRAAISVMSNIAEGFGRGGNREFVQFLSTAKGSVAEVKSQLYIALDAGFISQAEFDRLHQLSTETENLIGGFMRYLSRSNLAGPKFQNRASAEPRTPNPEP